MLSIPQQYALNAGNFHSILPIEFLPIEDGTRLRNILEGILLRNLIQRPGNCRCPVQLIS